MSRDLISELQKVEEHLQKSQITQGSNSERREWAGSQWTDEDIPNNAPNHTDYKPEKPTKFKSLEEYTPAELEAHLAMRKANVSNPIAAEREIMAIEGVKKSICKSCNGTRLDAITKSVCNDCGGYGFFFSAPNANAAEMIKSIAEKHNVGRADEFFSKAQKTNHGNTTEESDTTPKKGGTMTPVKEDKTGVMVNKGKNPLFAEIDEKMKSMEQELTQKAKTKKGDLTITHEDDDDMVAKGKKKGLDVEEDDEDDEVVDLDEEMKSTKKSIARLENQNLLLVKSLRSALSVIEQMSAEQNSISKSVSQHEGALQMLVPQHSTMIKSMTGGLPQAPARSPMARTSNVQVLHKSLAGDESAVVTARDNVEVELRYDVKDIQKGAFSLMKSNPSKKYLQDAVLRLDVNPSALPESRVLNEIQAHLDANGIPEF